MPDRAVDFNTYERLARVKGFVFDLDGTLALGDPRGHGLVPLPGAPELLDTMKAMAMPFVVFTNGTLRTPKETAEKLRAAGLSVSDDQAMTPSTVAASFFAERAISPVLVLGCEGVWRPLKDAGVEVVLPGDRSAPVAAVYVGWYREFTMPDLERAFEAVANGADLYTASNVPFFATSSGRALGTSFAICAMLQALTGKVPETLGKPSKYAIDTAGRILGVQPQDIAVVGDDPSCEIKLAHEGGALAIGVTTGVTSQADFERQTGDQRPDLVISGLAELHALMAVTPV